MDQICFSRLYEDKACNFTSTRTVNQCKKWLKEDSATAAPILLHYIIECIPSSNEHLLPYYHFKLLRDVAKNESEIKKREVLKLAFKQSLETINLVSECGSIVLQREFLKSLCVAIKQKLIEINIETMNVITLWFLKNNLTLLEKYFLKAFRTLVGQRHLNFYSITESLIHKGYQKILLRSSKDYFTDLIESELTIQLQARALDLYLNMLHCQYKETGSMNPIVSIIDKSLNVDLARGYIKSMLVDMDDDVMLLSNLLVAARLYSVLASEKTDSNNYSTMIKLIDIVFWFHHFMTHVKFDHELILSWLMDDDNLCENYLLLVLPLISSNLACLDETFATLQPEDGVDKTMGCFSRLQSSMKFSDSVNPNVSQALDDIGAAYSIYEEISQPDPLGGILLANFSSQLSLDIDNDVDEFVNKINPCIVDYSDSD